jgi:hypothetical protein
MDRFGKVAVRMGGGAGGRSRGPEGVLGDATPQAAVRPPARRPGRRAEDG